MKDGRKFLIISLMLVLWTCYSLKTQCNAQNTYFDKLNLHLTGKVVSIDIVNGYNGFDIIGVKIIHSNKEDYDPRGQFENYYCIIKNGYAELYQNGAECSIGDRIEVDSRKRIFTISKPTGNIVKEMMINDNKRYYEYLKKNHQRF